MEIRGRSRAIFIAITVAVIVVSFALGAFFGYSHRSELEKIGGIKNGASGKPDDIDFEPFWNAWAIIGNKFAGSDNIDRQKMVWGAIQGALNSLGDPYTTFFPPEEKKLFDSEIKGSFAGVGMEIGVRKGILTVIAPLKDTPAYNAGIKSGDAVLKIDSKETAGMTADEAVRLIRGERGTKLKLIILPLNKDKTRELTLIRDIIKIPIIETKKEKNKIFVIKLYSFAENSANEFRNSMRDMYFSGSNKLIIDLRGNPGGYLEAAVDIASWFLDTGKVVVREKFKSGEEQLYRSRGYKPFSSLLIVVLVDKGSASASEILAGALQDYGAAKLVGEKTFGKGSVQELVDVTNNTSLKVTIARWLTPNGRSISQNGLDPDVKVDQTENDDTKGIDKAMARALEILESWNK